MIDRPRVKPDTCLGRRHREFRWSGLPLSRVPMGVGRCFVAHQWRVPFILNSPLLPSTHVPHRGCKTGSRTGRTQRHSLPWSRDRNVEVERGEKQSERDRRAERASGDGEMENLRGTRRLVSRVRRERASSASTYFSRLRYSYLST